MTTEDGELAVEFVAALDEAARLLESGDAEAADLAMARATEGCPQLSAVGLGPEAIATARRLLERCRQAEARLRQKLKADMASLGTSRRAQAAYDR
jgi:hypothetical protein